VASTASSGQRSRFWCPTAQDLEELDTSRSCRQWLPYQLEGDRRASDTCPRRWRLATTRPAIALAMRQAHVVGLAARRARVRSRSAPGAEHGRHRRRRLVTGPALHEEERGRGWTRTGQAARLPPGPTSGSQFQRPYECSADAATRECSKGLADRDRSKGRGFKASCCACIPTSTTLGSGPRAAFGHCRTCRLPATFPLLTAQPRWRRSHGTGSPPGCTGEASPCPCGRSARR
jgi:hypothetical protein